MIYSLRFIFLVNRIVSLILGELAQLVERLHGM